MFGQTNTPFGGGGGGFGQPTAPGGGTFGSPPPAPLFGSPPTTTGAFGQPSSTPTFGGVAPAPSFGGGAFGAPAPAMFGAPAPAGGGAFGAPASAFGTAPSSSTATTFGAPTTSTTGGLFGSAPPPTSTGFGGGGLFGQAPAPSAFGAPAPGAFGGSTFGAAPAGGGLFGAPAPGAFGAPSAFGAPAPSAPFGSPAPFGAPAPAPSSVFGGGGAPSSAATGFFGSPAPAFGTPAPGLFGSPAPAFGAPAPPPSVTTTGGGLFGAAPAPGTFGAPGLFGAPATAGATIGTHMVPYQVTNRQDGTSNIILQSITAMDQYKDYSHEELRYADYSLGNRGTAAPAPMYGGGGFGGGAPVGGGGLFGSTPTAAPPATGFGSTAPSGGLFGGSTSTFGSSTPVGGGGFGATPAPSGGLFGSAPAPTAFGAPPPVTTGFGAPPPLTTGFGAPAFGTAAPSSALGAPAGGLFGSPAPAPGFGAAAPSPFGAPAPTGLFGSTPAPGASGFGGGTGLFGSTPAPGLFGAPAPGLFGAPTPATGGLFGSPAPAAPFGQTSAFGAPAPSLFGAAPAFGAPAPTGLFGQPSVLQPQPAQAFLPPQVVAPGMTEVMAYQVRALNNQLDELKKTEVWNAPRSFTSPAVTPTNAPDASPFFSSNLRPVGLPYLTPQSTTTIRPRGFAQSEPPKAVAALSSRRDNSGIMSPEAFVRSSQLNLVVRPDSLRRSNKLNLLTGESHEDNSPDIRNLGTIDGPPVEESPPTVSRSVPDGKLESSGKPAVKEPPVRSPGYEYYQQVIGTSNGEEPSQPITPAANGILRETPWYVPKLSKTGYEVVPSIDELASMSEADLASVRNFSVRRPGYGKVEWEGSVDVRGANLDDIVVIEAKDVSVYNKDEEKGTKPEEGTKLNRPAVITFDGVFPREGPRAGEELMEKFAKKVKKATETMNAEFVSYDTKTGIWKIRVLHFSRYALDEDESDDNDEGAVETKLKGQYGLNPSTRSLKTVRKATPYKSSRMTLKDMDVVDLDRDSERDGIMVNDVEFTAMDIKEEAEEAAKAITTALYESRFADDVRLDLEMDTYEGDDDDFTLEPVVTAKLVSEEQDQDDFIAASKGDSLFADTLHINPLNVVCGTRMGRSFRVGWCPNGSFIKLTGMTGLVIARPILSDETNHVSTIPLLESQQKNAVEIATSDENCPLYALSRDCRHCASALPDSSPAKQAFLLLSRIFSSDDIESSGTAYEEKVPADARIMAAVISFLMNLCSFSKPNANRESMFGIFDAIANGNISLACQLAASGGYTEMATILASTSFCQRDVLRFLDEMGQSSDLKVKTNRMAMRILRDLGGEFKWEDACFRDGDVSLDWCRRLLLRILQRPDDPLPQVLKDYERSLTPGDVPFPHPHHREGSNSSVKNFFYKLLQLCADPTCMSVSEAIDPSGYTPNCHDFEFSFHYATALSSVSNNAFSLSTYDAECIKDAYISQLVMQGYWEWAVFVALCCISSLSIQPWQTTRAKNLVLQHFCKSDPLAKERRDFLEQKIGVPSLWFDEALCYRAARDGDTLCCITHAIDSDLDFGREAYVEFVLPELVLSRTSSENSTILKDLADGATSDSVTLALYRFIELEKRIMDLSASIDASNTELEEDVVQQLQENLDYVYGFFSQLNESLEKTGATSSFLQRFSFLVPLPLKPVPFSAMVFNVLQSVMKLKEEFKFVLSRPF